MPDIPILNNIKGKVIPFLQKHHESIEEESENVKSSGQPAAEPTTSSDDILRQFRINPETELNDDVLTPSKIAKVRFRESSPKGFSFTDVEQFHRDVSTSLQWYIKTLEKRDNDIHRLATEIDKYITDHKNLRFEIEVLQSSGGQAIVDDKGNYVTESQLSNEQRQVIELEKLIETLNNRIISTDKELSDLKAKYNEILVRNEVLENFSRSSDNSGNLPAQGKTTEEITALEDALTVYRQWELDVTVAYEEMENSLLEKDNEIEALKASLEELKANPLVVESEPIVIESEPVIIENREELDAANEKIRLLEASNDEFKVHISELDKYIDVLEKSLTESDDEETEDYAAVDQGNSQQVESAIPPVEEDSDTPKIIQGIDISKLPPGIRLDDLF